MSKSLSRDEASRIVRNAGLRQTEARLAVLERLAALDAPASHAEMVERMSSFPYDSATIYRCLNDLADAGILARLELGDRTWRFEFRARGAGSQHGQHPHFLCLRCGRIVCLERRDVLSEDDRDRIAADAGTVTEILLKGVCHPCLESP